MRITYEPRDWAIITSQEGYWLDWEATPQEIAAHICAESREVDEDPVPPHWDWEAWWSAAEEALTEEIVEGVVEELCRRNPQM